MSEAKAEGLGRDHGMVERTYKPGRPVRVEKSKK